MPKLRKKSSWSWGGSSSIGGSVDIVVAVGAGNGMITLKDPTGTEVKFHYASAGVGFGLGAKFSFGAPNNDLAETGQLWIIDSFQGNELEAGDLTGGTLIIELSAGAFIGGSATAMLLGLEAKDMQDELYNEVGELLVSIGGGQMALDFARHKGWLESRAKAVLIIGSVKTGMNVSIDLMGYVGYMWQGAVKSVGTPLVAVKSEYEGRHLIRTNEKANESSWITIPGDVLFAFNRFDIKPQAAKALEDVGKKIRLYPNHRILVNGHTDNIGGKGYNLWLSQKRAEEVKKWFVSRGYGKPSNLISNGFGFDNPVAPNYSPEGRQKNRRVEIFIPPM